MWTDEQRKAHKPRGEGYPSDVSDEEWAIIEPMIPPARTGGRKRETNMREVFNAISLCRSHGLSVAAAAERFSPAYHGL
jgi:transposase